MNWRESRVMPIDKSGFIYIYTANETDDPAVNAYFDDLKITHKQMVVQADDYYPFGLSIEALSYKRFGGKGNDFKFNSKEADEELGLNWYAYGFRNYDPQLGRWHVQEPLADLMAGISPYAYAYNNPVAFVDLMGLMPGQNRPSFLQSGLDTSADSDGDGFVTPSEQFIFDTNNEGGGFDFAKEQNQRRKNKVSLPGGRIIQGDGTDDELFRVIEHGNQRVHIFYESFFAHGGDVSFGQSRGRDFFNSSAGGFNWLNNAAAQSTIFGSGITITTNQVKPRYWGPNDFARAAKTANRFGKRLGVLGLGLTAIDIGSNGLNTGNSLDAVFGVVAFFGPAGAAVSGTYFVVNMLTVGVTGQSVGDHLQEIVVGDVTDRGNPKLED